LRVLGTEHRLGVGNTVFQHRAGSIQVERSDALGAGQSGVGEGQHRINGSLVGGGELFGGIEHGQSPQEKYGHNTTCAMFNSPTGAPFGGQIFCCTAPWLHYKPYGRSCQAFFAASHQSN
jgi:hypothetical protein